MADLDRARRTSGDPEYLRVDGAGGPGLELRIAGAGARAYAFVIDWHIRLLAAVVALFLGTLLAAGRFWPFAAQSKGDDGPAVLGLILAGAVYLLYHPVLEWLLGGVTPGKRVAGIGIITRSGLPPGLLPILTRNAFRIVDSLPSLYVVGLLCTVFTRDHVRLGDLAAGTLLVYQRPPRRADRERFTALLATGGAPVAVALRELAGDLLDRWPGMAADARRALARDLLARARQPLPGTATDDAALRAALTTIAGRAT